jgi:hypothetical protein
MAGTTVHPAKVNLKALLEAWAWPDGAPSIAWGSPTENEDVTSDALYFSDIQSDDDFRILGGDRVDESYRLPVVIDVRRYGDDEQATEKRAWDLHDQILTLLHANKTLGGAINHIRGFVVRQGNPVPSPQQWRAVIVIEVGCVGFINY